MSLRSDYQAKLRSAEEAVTVIRTGQWIDYGMGVCQPTLLDAALAKRK